MPKLTPASDGGFDLLISFDTTGSMYPVFHQVLTNVEQLCKRLFDQVPGLRVGIIAHGDYCDGSRAISSLELTSDCRRVIDFVRDVRPTGGGDAPECYELVLNTARSAKWEATRRRVMVMIGDEVPHPASDPQNRRRLDWENEARLLHKMGVTIYPVQCRGLAHSNFFYEDVADICGTKPLALPQFRHIEMILLGVAFSALSDEAFDSYERELRGAGLLVFAIEDAFDILARRPTKTRARRKDNLIPEDPNRFQVLRVGGGEPSLKPFIEGLGLKFKTGLAFYPHVTRPEEIQDHKEVILEDLATGQMFTGPDARRKIGLPEHGTLKLKPNPLSGYRVWVQSTSSNRKLRESELLWDVTTEHVKRGAVHSRTA